MARLCVVVTGALLTVLAFSLAAQDPGSDSGGCRPHGDSTDCEESIAFFNKLKSAVSKNEREVVARMVSYPLTVFIDDQSLRIASPQSFVAHYNEIINPAERCAITSAQESDVWRNWQGYMIGRGAVWWDRALLGVSQNVGEVIDWAKVPFKVLRLNNINIMTKPCMKLNVIQTLSPDGQGRKNGTVLVDFSPAESFFSHFQEAVAQHEREKVADMVRYPVKLRIAGRRLVANDRRQFLKLYDSVFPSKAQAVLLTENGSGLTAWWEGIFDDNSLVCFAPVSGTKEFLIIELRDSTPVPATK